VLVLTAMQAAEDALLRLYLTRTPPDQVALPSSTFTSHDTDVYASDVDWAAYNAPALGEQEITYASAGRSSIVLGSDVRDGLRDV
jgi:large subunit ribosomal protein L44